MVDGLLVSNSAEEIQSEIFFMEGTQANLDALANCKRLLSFVRHETEGIDLIDDSGNGALNHGQSSKIYSTRVGNVSMHSHRSEAFELSDRGASNSKTASWPFQHTLTDIF